MKKYMFLKLGKLGTSLLNIQKSPGICGLKHFLFEKIGNKCHRPLTYMQVYRCQLILF